MKKNQEIDDPIEDFGGDFFDELLDQKSSEFDITVTEIKNHFITWMKDNLEEIPAKYREPYLQEVKTWVEIYEYDINQKVDWDWDDFEKLILDPVLKILDTPKKKQKKGWKFFSK